MESDQPKFLTKDELRSAAMRELKVSKNAFDFLSKTPVATTGTSRFANERAARLERLPALPTLGQLM
jgi:hypothetical protein